MKVSIHLAAETLCTFQREMLCLVKNAYEYNKIGAGIVSITIYEWISNPSNVQFLRIQHTCASKAGVELLSEIFERTFNSVIKKGGINIIETESCVSVDFVK